MGIFQNIILGIQYGKRREVLCHLMGMSDEQLLNCGFSPQRVAEGMKGWPWHVEDTIVEDIGSGAVSEEEQTVIAGLPADSDGELTDLDSEVGSITDAVHDGSPDFDFRVDDEAA